MTKTGKSRILLSLAAAVIAGAIVLVPMPDRGIRLVQAILMWAVGEEGAVGPRAIVLHGLILGIVTCLIHWGFSRIWGERAGNKAAIVFFLFYLVAYFGLLFPAIA